jgi:hypothetical protein
MNEELLLEVAQGVAMLEPTEFQYFKGYLDAKASERRKAAAAALQAAKDQQEQEEEAS